MRVFAIIILTAVSVAADPLNGSERNISNGWYVPQLDGSLEWITKTDFKYLIGKNIQTSRAPAVVEFYLYTKENPNTPKKLILDDVSALTVSNFNKENPTRIIIHGWQNNHLSEVNFGIRKAFLESGIYNVICVDWSDKAQTINYPAAVLRVPSVGKKVAKFLDFLHIKGGMSFSNLIVIGHSLGAHVSGFAGKNVKYGQIHQIIGLDPALPLYSYDDPSERLNQNDALYVESIQTCGGILGFVQPIGKGAFYPNGGSSQPGCGVDLTGSCAHARSYQYYSEAIRANNFPTVKCRSFEEAVDKSCGNTYSVVKMGDSYNYIKALGHYYVPVNKKSPYGKGA